MVEDRWEEVVIWGGMGFGSDLDVAGGTTSWKDRPSKTRPYLPFMEELILFLSGVCCYIIISGASHTPAFLDQAFGAPP